MNSSAAQTLDFSAKLSRGTFTLDATFATTGGITALFGPSGSGKTTILHLIAGLMRPDTGRIALGTRTLVDTNAGIFAPRHKRRTGLVFQDAQLFPHMSVAHNLQFGRWFAPRDAAHVAFDTVTGILGISALLDRRPPGLSGGERQRVALARALLANPQILLMDEPLVGLERDRRGEILPLIARMRDEFAIPIVYVTHAADEVEALADQVIMLEAGRVRAAGTFAKVSNELTSVRALPAKGVSPSA